ncbi:Cyclin-J18-like [Zostera marina]|uniref:Cyclin-J18-like n=1 Tax=Zostera marina TaxID=29655 RepID=A0A0K9PQ58_ZOSMR|nr:Cyclin-J18-like [Zostera marina]
MRGSEALEKARCDAIEFLMISTLELNVPPIVKYTALSLFADRFLPSLRRGRRAMGLSQRGFETGSWLLRPLTESNLQIFALISIWISTKLHGTSPISVKILKSLGDRLILDQIFTTRDFVEAELTFMEVIDFEIGASNITFIYLENIFIQFREVSRIGETLNFSVCMDIMDILYETEDTTLLYQYPSLLACSILAASYALTAPKREWEFPVLSWVKILTSCRKKDVGKVVEKILKHILRSKVLKE